MSSEMKNSERSKKTMLMRVPTLRFPEFVNESEWEIKKLNQICDINPSNNGLPDSFIYIDLESVESGTLKTKNKIYKNDAPSRAQRLLYNGDVIFQIVRPYQRNNLFVEFTDENIYVASTGYAQLRWGGYSLFLYYILHTDIFVNNVIAKCTGSSYPAINSSDLGEIMLSIPHSNKEQQKIADCLSSLDNVISLQTQKIDVLQQYKKGLMQKLFPVEGAMVPELRFGQIQTEWNVDMFNSVFEIIDGDRGRNYPKSDELSNNGFCIFLNAKNVTKDGFRFEEMQFITEDKDRVLNKGKLQRLDVILTTRGSIGQFAFFSEEVPFEHMRINSGMVILRIKCSTIIASYLYYFCKSDIMSQYIQKSAFGNAQQQLTVAQIKSFIINYPSIHEQQKIADCLSSLDELIITETQKMAALKTHKTALMQQLFPAMDEVTA